MAESTVYPHAAPVEILPDILFVHGRMRMGPGMVINRNMVAVRSHGEITLLNPIRLSSEGEKALEAYGVVKHAVRLGSYHGVDDAYTVERFGAEFWALEGESEYETNDEHDELDEEEQPDEEDDAEQEAAEDEGTEEDEAAEQDNEYDEETEDAEEDEPEDDAHDDEDDA